MTINTKIVIDKRRVSIMGTAFTEQEKQIIKEQLKAYAKEYMNTYGVKKTTVEQLAHAVGISKGAFYKFYESKELLFFEVLEDFHSEFYKTALKVLHERTDLSERERVEEAIWQACMLMQKMTFIGAIENELTYLLRKIPQEVLKNHYHSDDVHIKEIIHQSGIELSVSTDFVCTAVHAIIVLLINKEDVGEAHFEEILRLFIKSLCERMLDQ